MGKQIKVGVFVILGITLMTAIVFVIGDNRQAWSRKVTYAASFEDVAGLKPGAPVRMGGVDIGAVTDVSHSDDVSDRKIHVKMSIVKDESPRVRETTVARIVNKGLLGDKMIEMTTDGTGGALDPKNPIKTEEPIDFGKYLAQFEKIAQKTEKVVENVERATGALGDPQFTDDLKGTAHSFRAILDGIALQDGAIHRLIFDPEEGRKMDRALTNLEGATSNLNASLGDMRDITTHVKDGPGLAHALVYDGDMSANAAGALKEVHTDLAAIRQGNGLAHTLIYGDTDTQHLMGNVNAMSDDLRAIVANVRAGKGTIGALLVDPSVYEDIKSIVGNVDRNQVLRALVRYSIKADEKTPPPPPPVAEPKK
jgi:phospholipid/cholesterol/gamma-HCH transport system substrate-binding protein